jgi:pimeloyl-ACP methyl ester carboxylesterase
VPHLAGFHVVAQDLPGHGRSTLKVFTMGDALMDADAVIAKLDQGPPNIVGHSLGGYLGLRYAATRRCSGWIGFDGPFGVVYPWNLDDPGLPETALQIGREIRGINVVSDLAAASCPKLLLLCATAASPIEEPMMASRREIAEHIARHHPEIRIEWVQTGHDTIVFDQPQETATKIRDFLLSPGSPRASRP